MLDGELSAEAESVMVARDADTGRSRPLTPSRDRVFRAGHRLLTGRVPNRARTELGRDRQLVHLYHDGRERSKYHPTPRSGAP